MIKAVVFDMDDTLYPEREYLISGFNRIGQYINDRYGIDGAANRLLELFDEDKTNVYDRYIIENNLNAEKLLPILIEIYRDNKPTELNFYPDVMPLFNYLKENSIKIGVITDGRIDGQQNKVDALRLADYVDKVILTESLGGEQYRKPHPKAYEIMAELFGCKYDEMIFVGDNPIKDFAIGRRYPIITVEIMRDNKIHNNNDYLDGIKPMYNIRNLNEVIKLVE